MFIDSHCHLDFAEFASVLPEVLRAARNNGVNEFVVPSIGASNFATVISLTAANPEMHLALGMHPCFMEQHRAEHLTQLQELVDRHHPCAIGEIGLDFFVHGDAQQRQQQLQLLKAQLQIACAAQLPVLLHVRKAHDQVLLLLKQLKFTAGGIVHAFNGSEVQARRYCREFGFKLGFGGAITHPRATKLRHLVASLPLADLVFETDSPDMPIANMAEAYNQPANIKQIAAEVFALRPEAAAQIELQLELNTREVLALQPG
ncbi:MAG: TatD family hydrolase [Pseudomonadales bacterium]|nr:TatD family hydrolase [Pseudomonadales bacterium]NRA15022.1 TatD family hydrolase [Oceanospirillaceae bacterium]